MLKSSDRSVDGLCNEDRSDGHESFFNDGTPCAVKVACTVWVRGKGGDYIKVLPIDIFDSPDSSAASCCVWRAD